MTRRRQQPQNDSRQLAVVQFVEHTDEEGKNNVTAVTPTANYVCVHRANIRRICFYMRISFCFAFCGIRRAATTFRWLTRRLLQLVRAHMSREMLSAASYTVFFCFVWFRFGVKISRFWPWRVEQVCSAVCCVLRSAACFANLHSFAYVK